jgi:hypothetical protein
VGKKVCPWKTINTNVKSFRSRLGVAEQRPINSRIDRDLSRVEVHIKSLLEPFPDLAFGDRVQIGIAKEFLNRTFKFGVRRSIPDIHIFGCPRPRNVNAEVVRTASLLGIVAVTCHVVPEIVSWSIATGVGTRLVRGGLIHHTAHLRRSRRICPRHGRFVVCLVAIDRRRAGFSVAVVVKFVRRSPRTNTMVRFLVPKFVFLSSRVSACRTNTQPRSTHIIVPGFQRNRASVEFTLILSQAGISALGSQRRCISGLT